MSSLRWAFLFFCTTLIFACGGDDQEPEKKSTDSGANALTQALESVTKDRLESHVVYLADDARNGRMTGTPGYDESAAYVAKEFEALGLRPGGDDGWYQQVSLLSGRLKIESATLVAHKDGSDRVLVWKEDFIMGGDTVRPQTEVRAEVVFVGFGVHAPELGYSDYEDVDVKGKIVARFGGAPANFPHNERAYYSSGRTKAQESVNRGAIGTLSLLSRLDQKRIPLDLMIANAGLHPGMAWVNDAGDAANYHPELRGSAFLLVQGAETLFDNTTMSFEQALDLAEAGKPGSQALGMEVTIARATEHEQITSPNVVSILPGNDPELSKEYVVYTAHLDHIGTGAAVDGDDIYNGAYDNAMGIALLIEAARGFAALPEPPKRSILFIAVTGEERGLLGSDYYAHQPNVPIDSMIANVNLDMPLFLYPLADIIGFGSEHSSLEGVIETAVAAEDFTLSPDPWPEEVLFVRSDQYSFVKKGIPSTFLVPGQTSTDPNVNGAELTQDHLKNHYHQPSDDMTRTINWPSALRFARANVRIGYAIAQQENRPTWNEGDFFGEKFGN